MSSSWPRKWGALIFERIREFEEWWIDRFDLSIMDSGPPLGWCEHLGFRVRIWCASSEKVDSSVNNQSNPERIHQS